MRLHFTAGVSNEENIEQNNWHCMIFKQDFFDTLRKYGCLPISSIEKSFQMVEENRTLKQANAELEQKIETLLK